VLSRELSGHIAAYRLIDAEKARTFDETRRQVDTQAKSEAKSTVPAASNALEVKLEMKKTDWMAVLVGIVMILLSILVLSHPGSTITTLAAIVGVVALVRGIMFLVEYNSVKDLSHGRATLSLFLGILLIVLGALFLIGPEFVLDVFVYIAAIWFIAEAIQNLVATGPYKNVSNSLYVFSVTLNVLLLIGAVVLLFRPDIVWLSVSVIIGILLMIAGLGYLVNGFID